MSRIDIHHAVLQQPIPSNILSSLDVAVLEHHQDSTFRLLGDAPHWLHKLWPDVLGTSQLQPSRAFLFIEHFLTDAIAHWETGHSKWLSSGPWTETDSEGNDWVLEAVALNAGEKRLLLIKFPTADHQTVRSLLQEGREQGLEYSRMLKEVNKREVLLHCIVHDLSTPLASIKGSLTLLHEDDLVKNNGLELLEIGINQVGKMQHLIKDVLAQFAGDVEHLLPHVVAEKEAPSIVRCASEVAAAMQPVADLEHVRVQVNNALAPGSPALVCADSVRLERVIFNLVENAIRHAPQESEIVLNVEDRGDRVWTGIADRGPGVEDTLRPRLFQRFARGTNKSGKEGLGLYFCRITIEGWGGNIGYEPRNGGGSVFWFELPKPPAHHT